MHEPLQTILFVFVSGGAVWFLYGPYQTFCEDRARQGLFEIRNAVFDLAADGRLSFDSAEYQEIRGILNSYIRYAHHLSAPRLLCYVIFLPNPPQGPQTSELLEMIEDTETRREVSVLMSNAVKILNRLLLQRSPILRPLVYLIRLIAERVSAIRQLWQQIQRLVADKAITYSQT